MPETKYCSECGKPIPTDATYCTECGKTQAQEIDPKLAQAWSWYNQGVALRQEGRKKDAIKAYDKALEINPKLAKAWNNRGVILRDLGKNKDALKSYDKALEMDPTLAYAWHNRTEALRKLGRREDSIKSHDKAVEIDPTLANAWIDRGTYWGGNLQSFDRDGPLSSRVLVDFGKLKHRVDKGKKRRAHELALTWWPITGKSTVICDRCNATVSKMEGYICKPLILGIRHAGSPSLDVSGIPDLICEECFDRSPNAEPFDKESFDKYMMKILLS
jgi:tetratricopeptide (TPR) repeat protein